MLRPLPTVGGVQPTGNVSFQGAGQAEFQAAARLGQSIAGAASNVAGQLEAIQAERDEKFLSEQSVASLETLNSVSQEFREPEAWLGAAEGAAEQAIEAAPARVRQEVELMWRRRIATQHGQITERAYQDTVRENDQAKTIELEQIGARIDTLVREQGPAAWDSEEMQQHLEDVRRIGAWREGHTDLEYAENYADALEEETRRRVEIGAINHVALAAYQETGNVDAAREVAEEALGSLTLDNAVYESSLNSIMRDVRDRDRERERAEQQLLRANQGAINDALSEAARGNPPDLHIQRLLAGTEGGRELLEQMNQNLAAYEVQQEYITATPSERAAMRDAAEEMSGTARDRYEAALQAGQRFLGSFSNDPVGYVLTTDENLAARLEFAQSPDAGPGDLERATGELLDAQLRAGYLPRDTRILSEQQAAALVDSMQLDFSDPAARATLVASVQDIEQNYGRYAQDVFKELEDAGLNRGALYVANTRYVDDNGYSHRTGAASLAERAIETTGQERENMIRNADGNARGDRSTLNQVQAAVIEEFEEFGQTLVPFIAGSGRDRQFHLDQTYALATQAVLEGMSPEDAAKRAMTAFTDRYDIVGTVRIPLGAQDPFNVEQAIDDFMDNLTTDTITPGAAPGGQIADITDFENRNYARLVRQDGTWATRPDEAGVVLFDHVGLPVIDARTGEQVFIPWEDMRDVPRVDEDVHLRALGTIGP